ncbi:cell division protein FtsL, partial [Leptospira kmetyi]
MSAEPAPRPQQARTAAARPTSLRPVLRALPQRVRQQQMGRLGFAI